MPADDRDRRPRRRAPDDSLTAGRRPVLELLKAGRPTESVLLADGLAPSPLAAEIRHRAEQAGVPVKVVPRSEIERLAPGLNHQGVAAVTARFRYASLAGVLGAAVPQALFLDGVTDPQNLGSLLRSAEGAGFSGVVLPARRSASVTPAVRRASAGASERIPVARVGNLYGALDQARERGMWIVGLDESGDRDLWSSNLLEPPVGIVLGAEDRGLSPKAKSRCDELVAVPLVGSIGSLNVGVAGAIAMFEVMRRRLATERSAGGTL
ncbi:23S rRNA (guanosine(2251)-2'-O)-methyltransferase RlmB [soil metagenome]